MICIVKHFSALFNKTVNDDFRAMDGCMMDGVVVKVGCFQSVSTYNSGFCDAAAELGGNSEYLQPSQDSARTTHEDGAD